MDAITPLPPVSGLVLAGGRGLRMGGADKGLVDFRGRPMVASVLERFAPQVAELMISANRNLDAYARFGHPVFADDMADFAGPLAGLKAGLARARHELVATVPCDAPLLPPDLVARLLAALLREDAEIAVATAGGRSHPVFCLCRRALLPALADYLAAGGRKVDAWQRSRRRVEVAFDDAAEAFANLNSPADLPPAG
ncbi:molybdenum cofactor guanylyltransferase MobA [Pseudothauera rhizosphaerae]|uniref:Molybdenum cofactor guanylyltransferase n=1 Tax=Pseudothauera rhizosphaerae TaxID=2565932 RepID=A0A4S4ANW3_9RHOO|nr:molybdenum cofactor guanylyltransferase MobA [Pseudothauera rhizosphaerae]THF61292.1 molybdenum cofactor guanylyltransferase [Pseudothauera rhizosphaerae]